MTAVALGLAVVLFAGVTVVAGVTTPGYEPWRDTISVLASDGQPHALAVRCAFVALSLVVAAAANRRLGRPDRLALALAGAAGVVTGLLPKDLPGTSPATVASQVHVAAAVAGGAALVAVMLLRRATAVAVVTVALAIAFERTWGTAVHGAVERALVAVPLVWCTTLGHQVDRAPWRSPSKA